MKQRRFERFSYVDWKPGTVHYLWPEMFHGSDGLGSKTVVIHVPFLGFIAWRYKACWCGKCIDERQATIREHYRRRSP
jgi:thiol-disulfide isomerase/thioredoxin